MYGLHYTMAIENFGKSTPMTQILGKIVLHGTNTGVPGLLITVYFATEPSVSIASISHDSPSVSGAASQLPWERWGSITSGSEGEFEVIADDQVSERAPQRLALMVVVSAPKDADASDQEAVRLASCVRRNIGRTESVVLQVSAERLKAVGVRIPGVESDVEEEIQKRRTEAERQSKLQAEERRVEAERRERRRQVELAAEPKFQQFLSGLSCVSEERRNLAESRYVAPGTSVKAANTSVIQQGIENRINPARRVGAVMLSEEQAARFKGPNGDFLPQISASAMAAVLQPNQVSRGPGLLLKPSPALLCREHAPKDPCVEILEGKDPDDDELGEIGHDEHGGGAQPDESGPTEGNGQPVTTDINALIQKLVADMTPPESTSIFQANKRADIGEVQKGVTGFQLHSGPSDGPSFHDFHHLQIAFEHVWQELFDGNLEVSGKELFADLVEQGIEPEDVILSEPSQSGKSQKIPTKVIEAFDITSRQWLALAERHQNRLIELAATLVADTTLPDYEKLSDGAVSPILTGEYYKGETDPAWRLVREKHQQFMRRQGERIIGYANANILANKNFAQFHPLLESLQKALSEPYLFTIYAANGMHSSINFGIVATYRQKWEQPADGSTYQTGRLVKSVPLAPKEVRKFTKKLSVKKSRSQKEVENNLHSRKTEREEKSRAEAEIVQKALNKTNYQLGAEGGVNIGIANAKGSTSMSQDASAESQEVKKEFREAILKAAEEYKSERTVEINVSSGEESSLEESGEISNPNDEIPVTYLFFELQRRFRVSEKIHRVTPVILVAQDFPTPNQIDEDWIVRYDWILRRVILDDSFVPALNYLSTKVVGDEFALQEVFNNIQQQRRIVDDLRMEVIEARGLMEGRYSALQKSIEKRAQAIQEDDDEGLLESAVEGLTGGSQASPEAMKAREDAARDAYERVAKKERELQGKLEREVTALNSQMETYSKNLSDHLNRKEQISRLRVHLKDNIMYYMQAIWSHEPPDQRFFRLQQVEVPDLQGEITYTLEADPEGVPMPPSWTKPHRMRAHCNMDPKFDYKSLAEIADLDNLLGFKGNYMIFPLKQSNVLTEFMMAPYLDPIMGLRDPDPVGHWTLTEFVEYVCCLKKRLSKPEFAKLLPGLRETYGKILQFGSDGEEIVVPTDSLFIEALPGVHPILEDFKLMHRAVDVKKAQADVRAVEMENLRAAARLLAGEREDPNIEKKVIVEGANTVVVPDGG